MQQGATISRKAAADLIDGLANLIAAAKVDGRVKGIDTMHAAIDFIIGAHTHCDIAEQEIDRLRDAIVATAKALEHGDTAAAIKALQTEIRRAL